MFTGIIETVAKLVLNEARPRGRRLGIRTPRKIKRLKIGESIALNGVCLTLVGVRDRRLFFDVVPETLRSTTLGSLRVGSPINMERSLRYGHRIGGHFITGHVEAKGIVRKVVRSKRGLALWIAFPNKLKRFIHPKGSIAIDGASLTVARLARGRLEVFLIPYTLKKTNLRTKRVGEHVNLETDLFMKRGFPPRGWKIPPPGWNLVW